MTLARTEGALRLRANDLSVIRDLRLALRSSGDIVAASMFFVIAVVLFPLGVGPGALLALLTLPLFIPVMIKAEL